MSFSWLVHYPRTAISLEFTPSSMTQLASCPGFFISLHAPRELDGYAPQLGRIDREAQSGVESSGGQSGAPASLAFVSIPVLQLVPHQVPTNPEDWFTLQTANVQRTSRVRLRAQRLSVSIWAPFRAVTLGIDLQTRHDRMALLDKTMGLGNGHRLDFIK
ncbi:hypothetical protein BKA56DRAFT_619879 [Ilyonectria sp. MPI-CAGE-AT-0026]|nr:hypothetical protein BKA56DRAFT_619879 [Ilyonectria sp. MPI-CAGE-AT-0026]